MTTSCTRSVFASFVFAISIFTEHAFSADRPAAAHLMIEPAQSYAKARDHFQRVTKVNRLEALIKQPSPSPNDSPYWGAIQIAAAAISLRKSVHEKNVLLYGTTLASLDLTDRRAICRPEAPQHGCVSSNDLLLAALNQEDTLCKTQPGKSTTNVSGCANLSYSVLARLYHLSTREPAGSPSRLSPETERLIREYFDLLLNLGIGDREYSPAADPSQVFKEHASSENHIITGQGMLYFAAAHLARSPFRW